MPFFQKILLLITFFSITSINAQQKPKAEFGKPEHAELSMKTYPRDPEAAAVVLYERGKNYWKLIEGRDVRLIKEVHRKIKVIDAKKFNQEAFYIPYYTGGKYKDKITHFKAITHNGALQNFVGESATFETQENEYWSLKRFTFPNIQDGSVLEYTYQIESPNEFNFGGWYFQGALPKVYTEFVSEIPGNYVYHRSLIGNLPLDVNEVKLKEDCFWLPGHAQNADCELAVYAMKDVPAFKEEAYMLSKENYISKVDYELKEYTTFDMKRYTYGRDWDDVDKEFRTQKDLGKQVKFTGFFESKIPQKIQAIPDPLEKAKAVYYFIQGHFNWNGKSPFFSNVHVKEAFEERTGNASEINLALINALQAVGLDAKIMILSQRDRGLPRQNYPVLTDFNYAIAFLTVDGKEYLLDATDKFTPFGVVAYRALNIQGRVMDFKKGSYWHPITPYDRNVQYVNSQYTVTAPDVLSGTVSEASSGYFGINRRTYISENSEQAIIKQKEKSEYAVSINDYKIDKGASLEDAVKENYSITITLDDAETIYLYPILSNAFFSETPFKLKERNYPIDFGYPLSNIYIYTLDLNDMYEVSSVPENKVVRLPENAGESSVVYSVTDGKINVRFNLKLNHSRFGPEAYQSLQEFFNAIVTMQSKEAIVLKKI